MTDQTSTADSPLPTSSPSALYLHHLHSYRLLLGPANGSTRKYLDMRLNISLNCLKNYTSHALKAIDQFGAMIYLYTYFLTKHWYD